MSSAFPIMRSGSTDATEWLYVDTAQGLTEGKCSPSSFPLSSSLMPSGRRAQAGASVACTPLDSSPAALGDKDAHSLGKTTGLNSLYLLLPLYVSLRLPVIYGK